MSTLILTEQQQLLKDSATSFASDHTDLNKLRNARSDAKNAQLDRALYAQIAELGWPAIAFPENLGGLGLGYAELGIVLEELGRGLISTPLISSVVLGGSAVQLTGSASQKSSLIPQVCAGTLLLSMAYQESARHEPYNIITSLEPSGDGYTLNGTKQLVLLGGSADQLVIVARSSGVVGERSGLTMLLVETNATGVHIKNNLLIDGTSSANIEFENVPVPAEAILGTVGTAADAYDAIMARGAIALSAEMVGGIQTTFDTTLEYLKVREQFGAKIGTFQGLKHRAARWFCEVELSKAITLEALRAIDDENPDLVKIASACKARTSDTFDLSGKEGVQMHGGIGVTDEHDIGLYMKKARVSEMLFGDATYHTDIFATAAGY